MDMGKASCYKSITYVFWLVFLSFLGCATIPEDYYGPWGRAGGSISYESTVRVQIESLADPDSDNNLKNYVIASAMQGVDVNDLQFKEFARQLENGLSRRGYIRTGSEKDAHLLIRLAYGVGDAKTSTVTTSYGYSYAVGWWWYYVPPTTEQVTSYMRNIFIEAVDLKNPNKKVQKWKMTLKSEGGIQNMRSLFPFMVAAAVPYFGTNQPSTRIVEIDPFDEVAFDIWRK